MRSIRDRQAAGTRLAELVVNSVSNPLCRKERITRDPVTEAV
jgi:hypothetical protein